MDDERLIEPLHPSKTLPDRGHEADFAGMDVEYIRKGITLKLLRQAFLQCAAADPVANPRQNKVHSLLRPFKFSSEARLSATGSGRC